MFKVLFAPLYVIFAACKGLIKFSEAFEKLGTICDEAAGVGLDATKTWRQEEEAINADKLQTIRDNIAKAKAEGKTYQRLESDIQL